MDISDIKLRKISMIDKLLIYSWFNKNDNIQFKIKTKNKILLKDHNIWLRNFITKKLGCIWIIKYENKDIGNIRLNKFNHKEYEIDIFIAKKYRGLQIASKSLLITEKKLKKGSVIHSNVKKNNNRSFQFFIKNNYKLYKSNKVVWFLKKYI